MTRTDNDRPLSQWEKSILQLLARAHRALDEQGVPPADPLPSFAATHLTERAA